MIKRPISELPEEAERDTGILLVGYGNHSEKLARFNKGDYEWQYNGTFVEIVAISHTHFYYLAELEEDTND